MPAPPPPPNMVVDARASASKRQLLYHRRLPMGMLLALAGGRSARDVCFIPSATAEPTSTTAPSTSIATTPAATATTTTETSHLGKARVNLLLGLLQDVDEIASLLLVCIYLLASAKRLYQETNARTHCQW